MTQFTFNLYKLAKGTLKTSLVLPALLLAQLEVDVFQTNLHLL
jgi:hypothetical protein